MSRPELPHRRMSAPVPQALHNDERVHLGVTREDHRIGCHTSHRRRLGACRRLPSPIWAILEEGRPCLLVAQRDRAYALAAAFQDMHPQRRYEVQEVRS